MRTVSATKLPAWVVKKLEVMLNSGRSEAVYVAEALDEIASNANNNPAEAFQATASFLHGAARGIAVEATALARYLERGPEQK